jgi:methylenetetrahydrofolate dehydrogenase (NADP+)/methenyltetrahydrofolate cyclohydrolase
MTILDGKQTSEAIKDKIAEDVKTFVDNGGKKPHLAAVLVGANPASQVYVRNKIKACQYVGMESSLIKLDDSISEHDLLEKITDLNRDSDIDGYIVQLPLPEHINEERVNLAIDPSKDVDGFHPMNFGRMALGLPSYIPATPFGILKLLEHYKVRTEGQNVVVIGRSNIVGNPMSILLSKNKYPGNATVTLTHSRTQNLSEITRRADIIIVAIGKPNFLTADMVTEGACVVDVGINRVDDESRKRGYRLVGDVDFNSVSKKCNFITPVPGGVGPMTITGLLLNTLSAAKKTIYPD